MYEIMFMLTNMWKSRRKIKHVSTKFGIFVVDLSTAGYATQKGRQIWRQFIRDAGTNANRTAVLWTAHHEVCTTHWILRRGITSIHFEIW
jgi:hypothetical protein